MSYILDALRRAQADRERGQIPGLHAQQAEFPADPVQQPQLAKANGLPPAVLALVVVAILLLGLALWVALTPGRQGGAGQDVAAVPGAKAPPAPGLAVQQEVQGVPGAQLATERQPSAAAAPSPAVPNTPAEVPAWPQVVSALPAPPRALPPAPSIPAPGTIPPPALPPQATQSTQATQATPASLAAPAAAATAPASPAATPSPSTSTPAGAQPIPALNAEMRRTWPPLVVGGSVWSASASSRFVILNGEVLYEGGRTAAGVAVERIEPKSVVLRWQSQLATLPL